MRNAPMSGDRIPDPLLPDTVLVAEDDPVNRRLLERTLAADGLQVISVSDGASAWAAYQRDPALRLAVLDWMMPGMDGIQLCAGMKAADPGRAPYILLLTGRTGQEDLVRAFQAGADDFIAKPFDREELLARVRVGRRILGLQQALAGRVGELEEALAQIKTLNGLLPICSYCKKIRDDNDYWQQVEAYISERTDTRFSHGVCPECYERHLKPEVERLRDRRGL